MAVIGLLIAVFGLALKKGYIKVEVVDEESDETVNDETESDGEGNGKENQDYTI